ncbi:hypothetical protein Pmani_008089 [Petrolisthes manimaculis]|uniref:Uncharacterized protein n=1 Tax=Petrolisthes manimaculis TaxID=1843537 RepID=A0AAE1Q6C7_9EUCA|nr:hypothetical protein Pmani_008089 [Petrolisthes manimaculis]
MEHGASEECGVSCFGPGVVDLLRVIDAGRPPPSLVSHGPNSIPSTKAHHPVPSPWDPVLYGRASCFLVLSPWFPCGCRTPLLLVPE